MHPLSVCPLTQVHCFEVLRSGVTSGGNPKQVVCGFPYRLPIAVACGIDQRGQVITSPRSTGFSGISPAALQVDALKIARQDYLDYSRTFLYPSNSLMVKTGLWIELEAIIGFIVGLGLASMMGQRTVPVVLMIVPRSSSPHCYHTR